MKVKEEAKEDFKNFMLKNVEDDYSFAVLSFAIRWATAMEKEMKKGKNVSEIAKQTVEEADIEGITGYMYEFAVRILINFWEYGKQLEEI